MSEKEAKAVKLLDTKLDKKVIKTLTVCTVIMLIAIPVSYTHLTLPTNSLV